MDQPPAWPCHRDPQEECRSPAQAKSRKGRTIASFLHQQRIEAARSVIQQRAPATIVDLGCGDGALLRRLLAEPLVTSITGVDTCPRALDRLRNRIGSEPERPRVTLVRSCATRLKVAPSQVDCALLVEVIEHISPDRLSALERSVFSQMRARTVVVTTPNADFNALLGVPAHRFRHRDHRFEWGRKRFRAWANGLAARHDYRVEFSDIGGSHPTWGGPSQMAVFDAVSVHRSTRAA
ncbi:MAG: methyltransferase domain-containing protein [Pseudorhizobium sp.]